jgi:SAM-dependent methyltransferase
MPIQIDQTIARGLLPQLDDALQIVCNEFQGLDTHSAYHNAFARVLKPDPLGRVMMLGTDQRDLFVPLLRRTIAKQVPAAGRIFDIGAGDGQTFACVADAVPTGTTVSIAEPNPTYLAAYRAYLERQPHLCCDVAVPAGLGELEGQATSFKGEFPEPGSIDLALGLHMIFYAKDLVRSLRDILRFLKPGGAYFNVVTDEATAYNGFVLRSFIKSGGDTGNNDRYFAAMDERRRMLAPETEGGGGLAEAVRASGIEVEVEAVRQPSRMYGHTLADLLALANITVLTSHAGTSKFESAAKVLYDCPEQVDLRIETEGPRAGMWSVVQAQWVTQVRRVR